MLLGVVQEARQRMAELVLDKRVKGVRSFLESLSKLVGLTGPQLLRGKRQNPNWTLQGPEWHSRDRRERMTGKAVSLQICSDSQGGV